MGAVGVEILIIIDMHDAVLVDKKANVQDIGDIYAELKPRVTKAHKMHCHRSEYWVVVNGSAKSIIGERETIYMKSALITTGRKHRLNNPGSTAFVIIEVRSGGYVGEDDIVRFEDVYGRAAFSNSVST